MSGQSHGSPADTFAALEQACVELGVDAWDTYGVNAFVAVNESIFTLVNSEVTANGTANLGDSFTKIGSGNPASTTDDAATFKGKLAAFLVYAYGGLILWLFLAGGAIRQTKLSA